MRKYKLLQVLEQTCNGTLCICRFCVAWYPIYRIPSGNFRASFLTYHSLGHYVDRGQTLGAPACVVSPIVGLQSYNAEVLITARLHHWMRLSSRLVLFALYFKANLVFFFFSMNGETRMNAGFSQGTWKKWPRIQFYEID